MSAQGQFSDDDIDRGADDEIAKCLDFDQPRSFFLFAGAGSGKTRSLVKALNHVREKAKRRLQIHGQKVAVITYTNAARDEINKRLDFEPLVDVSTVHSFVWSLIKGHNTDIREWVRESLKANIAELEGLIKRGKPGTKTALDREKRMERYQARLKALDDVKQFTYNPDGDNRGRGSLNHAEVLKIGAAFLTKKPALRGILISRYPALLIDESQDTNRVIIEALFEVQAACKEKFLLGLFGDMMQRIYADGLPDLGKNIPDDWATPTKKLNHRCPRRVVALINKIRAGVDGQQQKPRSNAIEGLVRIFIAKGDAPDKADVERKITERMAEIGGDKRWTSDVKTLILEHHMAARRMGFLPMFEALAQSDRLRIGMVDGSLPVLQWFSKVVLPVISAKREGDEFRVAAMVRNSSPLLLQERLKKLGEKQPEQIVATKRAVDSLMELWMDGKSPRFLDVLMQIKQTNLFDIPDALLPITDRSELEQALAESLADVFEDPEERPTEISAYDAFLATPFDQIQKYDNYIEGVAQFDTHQGVKGLEFERVMVVVDDADARGFLFSYEKLFGVKDKSDTDRNNEREGKETGIDRTKRLFYVTCSRAERELAIVCYTNNPDKVRDYLVVNEWFTKDEIEIL